MSDAPTQIQLDALREVANIGCGHAVNALSRLVGGRRVNLEVPRAMVAETRDLPTIVLSEDGRSVFVTLRVEGELGGELLLVLAEPGAHALCDLLLRAPGKGELREDQRSALTETGNIVASACLTAISNLTGLRLLPSVPTIRQGRATALLSEAVSRAHGETGVAVVLEARFTAVAHAPIEGQLLLIPDHASVGQLLHKLGV